MPSRIFSRSRADRSVRPASLVAPLAALAFAYESPAQCGLQYLGGLAVPGVARSGADAALRCSAIWDPDGAGPQSSVLVVGGDFSIAGNTLAENIAVFDPATGNWSPLGLGTNGKVTALAVLSNGNLVAGGEFTLADGTPADHIARWDGTAWHALGSGVSSPVVAMAALTTGDLVVSPGIQRWDGIAWTQVPPGIGITQAFALAALPAGAFVASNYNGVFRWNGSTWSTLGTSSNVSALAVLPSGDIVAGGGIITVLGGVTRNIARWNGSSWLPMGLGTNGSILALSVTPAGEVIAGGGFTVAGTTNVNNVARWNGSTWSAMGNGLPGGLYTAAVGHLARLPNGEVLAGGRWAGGNYGAPGYNMARWDGASWLPVGTNLGFNSPVNTIVELPNREVVFGGYFGTVGGIPANYVARWNGTSWSPLGSGANAPVHALLTDGGTGVVAGGSFTSVGGVAADRIARWNGSSWSPLGGGFDGEVRALLRMPNGDIIAGGYFTTAGGVTANRIARWNGTAWSGIGAGFGAGTAVFALAALQNGDLVAGWNFGVLYWNGTTWGSLGGSGPSTPVLELTVLPNGNLIAGGLMWNGATWSSIGGSSSALSSVVLPNGHVIEGGYSGGPAYTPILRRWPGSGSTWQPIGAGTDLGAHALTLLANGSVLAGGAFLVANGAVAAHLTILASTCPASAVDTGAGCASSAGPLLLTADVLPWIGGTFRTTTTGIAQGSLCLGLIGLTPLSVPLSLLLPEGQPGCSLLSSLDISMLLLPDAMGRAQSQFALTSSPTLLGVQFVAQTVPLEFDGSGTLIAVRGSNGLALTIGSY